MLAGSDLVVGGLDLEPHCLQHQGDVTPRLLSEIARAEIEVAAGVVRLRERGSVGVTVKEEELGLGTGHHLVAHLVGLGDDPFERAARAAGEGRAVRISDIADQPSDLALVGLPREDLEGVEVGHQEHVRLLDAGESLDRRAVEHDLAVEGLRELTFGDLDVFDDAVDVGELEPQEMDLFLLGEGEDVGS
jgi:hypothetical protein